MENISSAKEDITANEVPDPEPLPDIGGPYLLVRPLRVKEQTKGGIYIPDQYKEDANYLRNVGRILAIGPHAFRSNSFRFVNDSTGQTETVPWFGDKRPLQVGDLVTYARFAGEKYRFKGVTVDKIKDTSVSMRVENAEDLDTSVQMG